jgi:hypothetical protein
MRRIAIPLALMLCCLGANTKPMSNLAAFVGSWSCATATSYGTERSTTQYRTIAGSDSLEFVVRSERYTGAGYLGYDEKAGRFFVTTADAYNGTSRELGSLQPSGMLKLVGTSTYPGSTAPIRETLGMPDPKHLHDRTEMLEHGVWTLLDDATCTRS